jgi:hypothetical protein
MNRAFGLIPICPKHYLQYQLSGMDSEPHDVEKQASAIAQAFFWSVAGRHQACVEQLQRISDAVPNEVWLTLCFEPLVFGLSFFGHYARKRYTALEHVLFTAELETATRWLLATVIFEPKDVGFASSQIPSAQTPHPARSRWVLTKGHERVLAPFSRWYEVRERQFRGHPNLRSDSGRLLQELKKDLARDAYRCPESVLRIFTEGVVSEAYRIRDEAGSSRFKGIIPMDRLARTG